MTPLSSDTPPAPATPRWGRPLAECVAVLVCAVAVLGAVAWMVTRPSDAGGATPAGQFIAFAFATMGFVWLTSPFLVGRAGWARLFRWAVLVDVGGIALLIAAAVSPAVGWVTGLKLYAILASFAAAELSVVWLVGRRRAGVGVLAGLALSAAAMTTLVWGHLPDRLTRPSGAADRAVLAVVRYGNPLLAANDAINPPLGFDWPRQPWMYNRYGTIGEARLVGLPNWWHACGLYLLAAAMLAGGGSAIRPRASR